MSSGLCRPRVVRASAPTGPSIVRTPAPARPGIVRQEIPGARGERGPRGPGAETTILHQETPSALWTLNHGLGRYPSLTLVDSAGDAFDADARYVDENTIVVTLGAPTAGIAYLN